MKLMVEGPVSVMCALARISKILAFKNDFYGLNSLSVITLCLNKPFLWVKYQAIVTL